MLDMFDLIHHVHWSRDGKFFKWRLYCLMQTGGRGGEELVAEEGTFRLMLESFQAQTLKLFHFFINPD